MVKIVISGINGKMGKSIGLLASEDKGIEIAGALESPGNAAIGRDIGEVLGIAKTGKKIEADFNKITPPYDVLVEFATTEAVASHIDLAVKKEIAMVIGATGFSSKDMEKINKASVNIPIVLSPNMSVGANLLFKVTGDLSKALGKGYAVEIIEAHHSQKLDAPSGTAKKLGEVISKARGKTPPIHSVRLGDIVGDHTVVFAGKGERIELTHRAHSRDAFAKGALDAAKFVAGKKPGFYSMQEVIESK